VEHADDAGRPFVARFREAELTRFLRERDEENGGEDAAREQ